MITYKDNDNQSNDFNFTLIEVQCKMILSILQENPYIIELKTEMNQKLNYTKDSLNLLMKVIDYVKDIYMQKLVSEEYFNQCVMTFAWYLGETMLKNGLSNIGCKWCSTNQLIGFEGITVLYISSPNGVNHFPIFKINKYIENASSNNILAFYDSCFELSNKGV